MNCRDFREIADSYLSDELLVETNHGVLRHLDNCPECRTELSVRRNVRERLRFAVKNSPLSKINPAFAATLRADLRNQTKAPAKFWIRFGVDHSKPLVAGLAFLSLILAAGMIWQISRLKSENSANLNLPGPAASNNNKGKSESVSVFQNASYIQSKKDALDDHKFCALKFSLKEKPITLAEAAKRIDGYNADLDTAVAKPLAEAYGDKMLLLEAHFCIINGRRFAHVVLKSGDQRISVMVTKRDDGGESAGSDDAVNCESAESFQMACFRTRRHDVFVVSDLAQSENLHIAQTITASLRRHLGEDNEGT